MEWSVIRSITLYLVILRLCIDRIYGVRFIGACLLTAHGVHDVFYRGMTWPMWMEPIAVAMGFTLCLLSRRPGIPRVAGVAMMLAHIRQMIQQDDRYYWP